MDSLSILLTILHSSCHLFLLTAGADEETETRHVGPTTDSWPGTIIGTLFSLSLFLHIAYLPSSVLITSVREYLCLHILRSHHAHSALDHPGAFSQSLSLEELCLFLLSFTSGFLPSIASVSFSHVS